MYRSITVCIELSTTDGSGSNGSSGSNSGTSGTGTNTGSVTSGTPGVDQVNLSTYKKTTLGGSVTAGGTYDKDTQVTIEATPAEAISSTCGVTV